MERDSSAGIERDAARWVARMDRAPLSAADSAELERWLAGDVRRRGALLRARALWMQSRALRGRGSMHLVDPAPPRQDAAGGVAAPARGGRVLRWGGAMAASLLLAVVLASGMSMPVAYATAKGEMRRVPLASGASLTLNTDTRIRVYPEGGRTRVHLQRGELYVETGMPDTEVVVEVDGRRVDASSASFIVRKLDGRPGEVVVQDGQVELPAAGEGPAVVLAANTLTPLSGDGPATSTALPGDGLRRQLAWREGKIAFHGESLAEAAGSFARYSDTRIVIGDPQLARQPVTGLFAANNPAGFARAAAVVFDARMHEERGALVLESRD